MKLRNGFVSNSSSSSFFLVTTRENHFLALEKLSQQAATFIKEVAGITKKMNLAMVNVEYGDLNRNYLEGAKGFDNDPKKFYVEQKEDSFYYDVGKYLDEYINALSEMAAVEIFNEEDN